MDTILEVEPIGFVNDLDMRVERKAGKKEISNLSKWVDSVIYRDGEDFGEYTAGSCSAPTGGWLDLSVPSCKEWRPPWYGTKVRRPRREKRWGLHFPVD